ncbi:hypothetical protein E3N88_09257 [Mikania micrantha]|uniref:Uncharacterized protein n=1 Tax=Mikania micrantha TaxID=192012 RepID=A0A5N6PKH7_9ASTR|nr:hypothetical protein E3N88_09257 [Mikania micrantha]
MVSNERILVMFNKYGKPVGDEGKELVQYLGTLVRMPEHVSIEYSDWRKVPMQQKEDMYSLVKSKFSFHQGETSQIKKWILYSMGKKWRTWKGILKSRGYDASLTIDEIVTQQTNSDDRVNATQFKELVKRWFTPEFQLWHVFTLKLAFLAQIWPAIAFLLWPMVALLLWSRGLNQILISLVHELDWKIRRVSKGVLGIEL